MYPALLLTLHSVDCELPLVRTDDPTLIIAPRALGTSRDGLPPGVGT
jgi:hypothetical protein